MEHLANPRKTLLEPCHHAGNFLSMLTLHVSHTYAQLQKYNMRCVLLVVSLGVIKGGGVFLRFPNPLPQNKAALPLNRQRWEETLCFSCLHLLSQRE